MQRQDGKEELQIFTKSEIKMELNDELADEINHPVK